MPASVPKISLTAPLTKPWLHNLKLRVNYHYEVNEIVAGISLTLACSKVHSRLAESCNSEQYESTAALLRTAGIAVLGMLLTTAHPDNFASRWSYRFTGN